MTTEPKDPSAGPETEEVYTVRECGVKLKTSDSYARRLFEHEPGVIHLSRGTKGKRRYHVLRVPRSVFERKMAQLAST